MNRVGIGYDVHRFDPARPLILGGVEIPDAPGLDGHSDADVLSHAIADALLGAAGEADIGHFFPNTDESIRGISSQEILRRVCVILRESGWEIGNVDATLIAEKPKISGFLLPMKTQLAATLGLNAGQVGIKATTNERMGFVGREEGIAAMAVASLFATAAAER